MRSLGADPAVDGVLNAKMSYRRHPTNHRNGSRPRLSFEDWKAVVESARDYRWLVDWQSTNNLSDQEAADETALSVAAYRRQRSGRTPVSRQTAALALKSMVDLDRMLKVAKMTIYLIEMSTNRR